MLGVVKVQIVIKKLKALREKGSLYSCFYLCSAQNQNNH